MPKDVIRSTFPTQEEIDKEMSIQEPMGEKGVVNVGTNLEKHRKSVVLDHAYGSIYLEHLSNRVRAMVERMFRDDFLDVTVADIATAIADAATAQATADGQLVGFYQDDPPGAGMYYGDIWIDTNGADPLDTTCIYRYQDGSGGYTAGGMDWVNTPTNAIGIAYLDAVGAQATADGKIITFIQDEPPTAEGVGDLWIDTNDDNKPYRWSGAAWTGIRDAVVIGNDRITFSGDVYSPDDPAPDDSIIVDLAQPDCIASDGTVPNSDKEIVYVAPYWEDENGVKTYNPETKLFDGGAADPTRQGAIGIFQGKSNLAKDSEDLTTTNWTNVNSADELSNHYIDGKRFTKIINVGANLGNVYQSFTDAWTTTTPSFSVKIKKGSVAGNNAHYKIYNTTNPGNVFSINVDFDNYPNAPAVPTHGVLHDYRWLDSETVELRVICDTIALNDNLRMYCYGSPNATDGEYTYFTAVQAEDHPYPLPYTPTTRADGKLDLPIALENKFTLIFWIRPWFLYDTAGNPVICEWYISGTQRFGICYSAGNDKILVRWRDGGTTRFLLSQQFDDGGTNDINQWIMVAMSIDLSAQGQTASRLKVYTEAGSIGEDTDWGAAPDAFTGPFPLMSIGHKNGANEADSLLTDLIYIPNTLFTEAQMDAHYTKNRPWYSPTEVTSENKSVRIDKSGIRMHNASLTITDNRNRLIDISNRTGLLAKDAAGTIIHDIPDAPVLTDMRYGGHLVWKNTTAYVSLIDLDYTNVNGSITVTSALNNVDLSTTVPAGMTNVKGALVLVDVSLYVSMSKVNANTIARVIARYSREYNVTPATNNEFAHFHMGPVANIGDNVDMRTVLGVHALVPVVYNGLVPYITWNLYFNVTTMTANNARYRSTGTLYVIGFFV